LFRFRAHGLGAVYDVEMRLNFSKKRQSFTISSAIATRCQPPTSRGSLGGCALHHDLAFTSRVDSAKNSNYHREWYQFALGDEKGDAIDELSGV
jgi:hypothetical protein